MSCDMPLGCALQKFTVSQFQVNTMAALVRFYKKKYMQYRPLYERLKEEHAEAKRLRKYYNTVQHAGQLIIILMHAMFRLVDDLRSENEHLVQQLRSLGGEPSDMAGGGKRRRADEQG